MEGRNVLWIVVVAVASVVCWQASQSTPRNDEDAELYRLFVDAVENVDRSYVKEVNRRELIESAIVGMLDGLDPYSNFIGSSEYKQFDRQTKGKFGGIGIQIGEMKDGMLTVVAPLVGTPAYEAGVLAGDRILAVNGESLQSLSQSEVVDRLTGPPGSDVTITIQHRPYKGKPIDVKLTRALINVESILSDARGKDDAWDFILDKDSKVAYIRLNSFVQNSKAELERAIQQAQKDGMRGLILDLRYNPGGLLQSAVEICDLFIKDGVIVSTKGRNTEGKTFTAHAEGTLPDFPMAVLVNQYSASASEIVAACLQDHHRAVVVGERTWGKGSVQNVIELEDGKSKCALKLTTASYCRPNGHNIHRFKDSKETDEWGVTPNKGYEVKFRDQEHNRYWNWRRTRDQVLGKGARPEKAAETAKTAPADKSKKPGEKEKAASEKSAKAALADAANDFKDTQLEKALEYLRGELGKTSNKIAKAPSK